MREAFKEALGYTLGKFVGEFIIELIRRGANWLAFYIEEPEKAEKEFREKYVNPVMNKEKKPEKIKFGFM